MPFLASLPESTRLRSVGLTVPDLDRSVGFYTDRLGMKAHALAGGTARLGAGGEDLLVLVERRDARHVRGTTGLFHFALLLPGRAELALAFRRLVETRTPMQGAADHLVSEALYLADPDGNGIEIYRDRPRSEWRREDGEIAMATEPLDLETLLEEASGPWAGLPAGTVLGHVHLHVARIAPAERFYVEFLGLHRTARYGPAASFFAAGGYHHHVAVNTWAGLDAPRPPADAVGLREFEIVLPGSSDVAAVEGRAEAAGVEVERSGPAIAMRDPSGNAVRVLSL